MQITKGADNIGTYNKTSHGYRKWCKTCGGHIFTEHPAWGLTDVYAAVIPDFPYQAGIHVHYQETKLRMKDDIWLRKFSISAREYPERRPIRRFVTWDCQWPPGRTVLVDRSTVLVRPQTCACLLRSHWYNNLRF